MVRLTFMQTMAAILSVFLAFGGGLATFFSQVDRGREAAAQQYGDLKREVDDQKEALHDISSREDQFVAGLNAKLGQMEGELTSIQVNVAKLGAHDGKR